jgi:thioredoxin 1
VELTRDNFEDVVTKSNFVVVDFWAPWCGPCRAVAPVIEQIATMRKGAYTVVKCNIDESPDIAQRYDVRSIPMIGLFRNGRLERSALGAKPRPQLEAELGMLVIP